MRVLEFIQEKKQQIQLNNAEFRAKLEPQFKSFSDRVTKTIFNTLNNPWISLSKPNDDELTSDKKPIEQIPEAAAVFSKLQQQIGQETFVGDWYMVDQRCIDQFAEVTGDHQWIHTNPERAAKESPFKTTIAHGFLTLSLIPSLTQAEKDPYPEAKMIVNYGLNQVRFPFPVRSGSRVRARTKLIELVAMKRSIEVVNEVSIEVENSKRMACVAQTVVRLYF
ncbi:MAG: MaoC family dehydratase [Kangiellaceae bacterium]|jgi:acyl dehydratase|nr:MaoC family dehydratase [Kangiellaceae bacterium]